MTKIAPVGLLIVGLILSVYLVLQQTNFFSKADISNAPLQVKISNISDNSFTVSWITYSVLPGFITFGKDQNLTSTALDDRDNGGSNSRITHHVTLKDLEPSTVYYFKIGSGAEIYDDQGKFFMQTTAPTTSDTPPFPEPLLGTVVREDGASPAEALVYLEVEKGTVLSTYIRDKGKFLLTLTNARTDDLSTYLTFDTNRKMKLIAVTGTEAAQQDIDSSERFEDQKLVLQKSTDNTAVWPADLNGDGVVNAVDFAVYIKSKLNL